MVNWRNSWGAALGISLVCVACGEDEHVAPGSAGSNGYSVTIRQTSYGIPHVRANDVPSAVAGLGYVGAREYGCILLDQIVRVHSERAKFFGPGTENANVNSDFAMLALGIRDGGVRGFEQQSAEMRAAIEGYVAGFNYFVAHEQLSPLCNGKPWVRPLSGPVLFAYYYWLAQLGSGEPLLDAIAAATPPATPQNVAPGARALPRFATADLGSNGWAIGSEKSASGRGMLLANPHFPWEGNLRFFESQITVPGVVNVYGASLLGAPVINIGFNEHVAWTHTVTTARHFTLYRLKLVPGNPTQYLYDGKVREMAQASATIDVLEPDGTTKQVTRTLYQSHYGPMISIKELGGWGTEVAYTFRNANQDNFALGEQWFRMNKAKSLADLRRVNEDVQGIPWVNTMAVDESGTALYMDATRTPNLSDTALLRHQDALANDIITRVVDAQGATLLDGSDSAFEWQGIGARAPGIVPFSQSPQQQRKDFVFNANDSYWLSNPNAPLTGYSLLFGTEGTPRSPRTRMNMLYLTEAKADGASGADGKFTFDELASVEFSDRASMAEVLVDQVLARCQSAKPVTIDTQAVSVASACQVLAAWDRRLKLDSVGAVLWREFLASFSGATNDKGALFADAFDANAPVTTPNTLVPAPATGDDPVIVALARASVVLKSAGFEVTARLGDLQHVLKGTKSLPIHGGSNLEGAFNIVGYTANSGTLLPQTERGKVLSPPTGLTSDGYLINNGSSFMMVLEFEQAGPRAQAVLSYSESSNAGSTHFADQTQLFSESRYRPILFTEAQIMADPNLELLELQIPRD